MFILETPPFDLIAPVRTPQNFTDNYEKEFPLSASHLSLLSPPERWIYMPVSIEEAQRKTPHRGEEWLYSRRIVFSTLATVFEFEHMKFSTYLSTFDRIGVGVVAFLGAYLGLEGLKMATANDSSGVPVLAVIFPGAVIGFAMSKFVGIRVAVIVSGLANGAIYGLLMYGWNRFANRIAGRGRRA